jgi:hypothetical protein
LFRTHEQFSKDGASEKIVQIRLQHYEEKRKAKIKTISDAIRENLLEQFKARYDQPMISSNSPLKEQALASPRA